MPHIQIANPNKTHTGHHLMPWGYMEPKSEAIIEPKIYQIKLFRSFFEALEFKGGEITWKMSNKQRFGGIWNLLKLKAPRFVNSLHQFWPWRRGLHHYHCLKKSFLSSDSSLELCFVTNLIKIKGRYVKVKTIKICW